MARFVFDWDPGYKKGILQSDCLDVLREALSIEDKDASMARYKNERKWTSIRKYPITPNGRFSLGLFPEIYKKIKTLDIPYTTIITEKFKENFLIGWNKNEDFVPVELDMPPRYYQNDCIKQCMKYGNGVVMLGTAGGKTLIMAMLLHNVNLIKKSQTLIITSPTLMAQAIDDFIGFGIHKYYTMSQWDSNHPFTNTDIVIASSNILMSKKQDKGILSSCDLVLIDECHKLRAGNEINKKIIKNIKTPHKFGFTGSLPEETKDSWNIVSQLGPVIYEKKSEKLREEGYISNMEVVVLKLSYDPEPVFTGEASIEKPTELYNQECDFIYTNEFRNNTIGKLVSNFDKNALVLVDRLEHQQLIIDVIKKYCPNRNVQMVRGDVSMDAREEIRALMEQNDDVICVAIGSTFATGISIDNLHYLLFCLIGKAKLKILQSIGRGLRLHKNKSKLIIFDLADNLYYGLKHLIMRLELYEEEKIQYVTKEIKQKDERRTEDR